MTEQRDAISELLGRQVVVTNPDHAHTAWTGKLIGYRAHPCVTLEFTDGTRDCLPAAWLEGAADDRNT